MLRTASKVTINTGNVLNLIDIKKKAGQNATEELSESIKLTLSEWSNEHPSANPQPLQNGATNHQVTDFVVTTPQPSATVVNITRPHDDVQNKMAEEERKNLKIGVKIFINEDSTQALNECLENVFTALHTDYIDNVTLAYNPPSLGAAAAAAAAAEGKERASYSTKASPISVSNVRTTTTSESESENEADLQKCEKILPGIKVLWAVLEDYVKDGRVLQLGIADVGGSCLMKLHGWARVRPAIAQINLAACCVVPPALHAFCKENDVQLLTHIDPPDLLSIAAVKTLSDGGVSCNALDWCARYQVHIKCRGVLALKGYVCKATLAGREVVVS